MTRRVAMAVVALLLAVVAGGGAYAYLHDIQKRAYHNAALASVYQVKKPIPAGTPAGALVPQGFVARGEIPNQFRPTDAVTDLATLRGEQATAAISAGQVLDASQFAAPATATANSPTAAIPPGDVAISVALDAVHEVAGLVRPGDKVDILVELGGGTNAETFLYQDVPVLAVGTTVSSGVTQAVDQTKGSTTTTTAPSSLGGLITFAVPPAAAQRIAFAESGGGGVTGQLYLTLLPSTGKGTPPSSYPPVDKTNLIPANPTP